MNNELKILQNKYAINLFEWNQFFKKDNTIEADTNILILGDCNEYLVLPLAKRVKNIDLILDSEDYKQDFSYISLPKNVNILDAYTKDLKEYKKKIKDKYDYILIPSLSKIIVESFVDKNKISDSDVLGDFLKNITKELADNGTVMTAFSNSMSINVISGEKLDVNAEMFSYEEILKSRFNLSEAFKKSELKIYFPMPEYKFPIRIYSEKYLPSLDDEDQLTRNLVRLGKFKEHTESFLIIFNAEEKNHQDKKDDKGLIGNVIYIKYNIDRVKKYALRTFIIDNGDKRYVVKKALADEANEHILNLQKRAEMLDNKNIKMVKPEYVVNEKDTADNKAYIVFPFIDGEMLSNLIIEQINNGAKPKDIIEEYMDKIIGKSSGIIDKYNLDCTFSNAIVDDKNNIYMIDGEWIDDSTTEVDFLRYRILKYFYNSYKQNLKYNSFKELLLDFSISKADASRYEEAENDFQKTVHGNINDLDTLRYDDNKIDISNYHYIKSEYDRVKEQLDGIVGDHGVFDFQAHRLNEIIRKTNVHVKNLEVTIDNLRRENSEYAYQAWFYHKRESIIFKVLRKIKELAKKLFKEDTVIRKILKYFYRTMRHPLKMLKIFFTREGRNRILGDFLIGDVYFECGKVDFPHFEKPKVSIVIPCYNQIRYTYKCLYSIMKNTDANLTPYEVIIADDNSTDTTKNIKKFIGNVVVSRNEENLGFLKNCNKAAALAKGEYIYFLNNDTEVKENYLSSLVELIERDITIGMVGSKLIFADGTLQEAGGIIWSDGTGANYGRGQNPKDFRYNYVKEVDYISGASIMIRKHLWDTIGGFDERYAPAYCEDSDLAFEVRKMGMKVMYQPMSEIIHYEGVSNGKDVNDTNSMKSYQLENMKKLKEKWDLELLSHYPASSNPNYFKARERNFDKKVVLFVDHYIPTWDKDAGSKTTFAYIKMLLKRGYIVKFMGDSFNLGSPYGEILQQLGVEILHGVDIEAGIWAYLDQNKRNIDIVYLNRPHIAGKYIDFIRDNMNSKIIFYGHDLHYLRLKREYEITHNEEVLSESRYYRGLEFSILHKADMSFYPSEIEVNEIHSINEYVKVKALQAFIYDKVDLEKRDWANTKDLLFVGGFAHNPNVDAIKWFDEAILPRIKARNPNIKLTIVGSGATDEIKAIGEKPDYNFLGYVTDEELEKLYEKARIVIAPLRYGAGIKGKIIEAMSKGSAIVTTNCGAEGIEDADKFMMIGDSAQEFAHAIVKLYDNFDELHKLSYYARKEINKKFTEDAAWDIIKDDF